jgi:cation transport protein ChaC
MSLTRADLENDRLRKLFREANPDVQMLSDAELDASAKVLMDEHVHGDDVWVFGYGSLIWNPIIRYAERRVARVDGFHRHFCLWSHVNRGSMEKPGLVLGLDTGGNCLGVAFRIAAHDAPEELRLLWRREMVLGSYCPRWVSVDAGGTALRAITFVVNHRHPSYAGRLPIETVIRTLVSTRGYLGTPAEYLLATVRGLVEHGVNDAYLMELRERVLAMHPELAAVPAPAP